MARSIHVDRRRRSTRRQSLEVDVSMSATASALASQEETSDNHRTSTRSPTTTRRRSSRRNSNSSNRETTGKDDEVEILEAPYQNLRRRTSQRHGTRTTSTATATATSSSSLQQKTKAFDVGHKRSAQQPFTTRTSRKRTKSNARDLLLTRKVSIKNKEEHQQQQQQQQKQQHEFHQVTPSPAANTKSHAFPFDSPTSKAAEASLKSSRLSSISSILSKPSSSKSHQSSLPPGVVDLYPQQSQGQVQSLHCSSSSGWTCNCMEDDCSAQALGASFLHSYGKEYYDSMKQSEKAIVPSKTKSGSKKKSSSSKSNPSAKKSSSIGDTTHSRTNRKNHQPHSHPHSHQNENSSVSIFSSSASCNDSSVVSVESHETPLRRRVYYERLDTSSLSPVKATESSQFLDYQPDLTPKMRAILMDWIIELSEHFHFGPTTLHLAITLIDEVLTCGPLSFFDKSEMDNDGGGDDNNNNNDNDDDDDDMESKTNCFLIKRDRFQLLGAACTWLACKMEEHTPPHVAQIAYVSDNIYSVEQIKRMERRVCNALNFGLARQTPFPFVHELLRASQECAHPKCTIPKMMRFLTYYLLELGRLPFLPVTQKPSLLAAASVYLARVTLGKEGWTPTMAYYSGYQKHQLKDVVLAIHSYQHASEESTLASCFSKYKQRKYLRVALKTVVRVEDLGF